MKLKVILFIVSLFLNFCFSYLTAQKEIPKGKAQLVEFSNSNSKFIVPTGKTWYINNTFSFFGRDPVYWIFIKSINGVILTDYVKKVYGPILYHSDETYPTTSLVFPENTSFELIILSGERNEQIPSVKNAFLNYIEVDN